MSKKIGTHSGSFHCDEALACYLLTEHTAEWKNAKIVRTRDSAVLATLPILVDVGGVYDPTTHRYDHHQRGFTEVFGGDKKFNTKLSSAGLIYKHFGKEIIASIIPELKEPTLSFVFEKVYENFIEGVDGIDNGVSQYPSDIKAAYRVKTDLSSRVGRLNPSWNETLTNEEIDVRFARGMSTAGEDFLAEVYNVARVWLPAREIVERCLNARSEAHPSGEVVVLDQYTVWASHLFDLESELKVSPSVKYVLYQDSAQKWRIQAVAEAPGSFASRLALPEAWRGVRDEELSKLTGIPGCVFAHASGFIGGNATFEGVKAMAVAALAQERTSNASLKRKADVL